MGAKYLTIILAIVCVFQLFQLNEAARLVPRSADGGAPTTERSDILGQTGQKISQTLESWRDGVSDILKKAPSVDDVVSGATNTLKKLSTNVENFGRSVADSLKPSQTPATTS